MSSAEPGFWDLPPGLTRAWRGNRNSARSSSSSSFTLHDPSRPALPPLGAPTTAARREGERASTVLYAQFEQRRARYCHLSYDEWRQEVRYHCIRPLDHALSMDAFLSLLCAMLMLLLVPYTTAMFRFVMGGGVGSVVLVTASLPYSPAFNTSDGSSYTLISGQAQYGPFGYVEVVTVQNSTTVQGQPQLSSFQYTDSSSFDSSCGYTVYSPVTSFTPPSWGNNDLAAPNGESELTLYAPGCSALNSLLGCYIGLCVVLWVGGVALFGTAACCGRRRYSTDIALDLEDVHSLGNEPEIPLRANDAALFKDLEPVVPPPPRCALAPVQERVHWIGAQQGQRGKALQRQTIAVSVIGVVQCSFALATLVSVVEVVREPGFGAGRGTGPMLPLILVSCCAPLLAMPCWIGLLLLSGHQERKLARMLAAQGYSLA